jgi:hypothetical protein
MRNALILATALALMAGPALASHIHPQTFQNTPDPQPAQVAQAATGQANTTAAPSAFPSYTPMPGAIAQAPQKRAVPAADPMDPNMNPHWLRGVH